jgi:thiamine pyrophosphokinase
VRAIIIAGGQAQSDNDAQRWVRDGDLIIGADGGAVHALKWGLTPHQVIGDMDSLPEETRDALEAQECQFIVHPRAKDETDLELALSFAVKQGAHEIIVLGALGGRLDHALANVLLLALPWLAGISVRIIDGDSEVVLLRSGEAARLEGNPGDLVSLLPLVGEVRGVITSGLAWKLQDDNLYFGATRGVSNEMCSAVAHIEVGQGYLLVVHSPPSEL